MINYWISFIWLWGWIICAIYQCYKMSFSIPQSKMYTTMWGYSIDCSDSQWCTFRKNIYLWTLMAIVYTCTSKLLSGQSKKVMVAIDMGFLYYLHGYDCIYIYLMMAISFYCHRWKQTSYYYPTMFAIQWAILLIPFQSTAKYYISWQDSYRFVALRIISWSVDAKRPDIWSYIRYICYIPTYATGPIITFNDFQNNRHKKPTLHEKIRFTFQKFLIPFAILECWTWFSKVFAIGKYTDYLPWLILEQQIHLKFSGTLPIFMFGVVYLMHIYLKLLCIWRFARCWALWDNRLTPPNMTRCIYNTLSIRSFWKHWHVSFNKWIIKYIYIPLGGNCSTKRNTFIVFLLVALWHEPSGKLITWGLACGVFIAIEILLEYLVNCFETPSFKRSLTTICNASILYLLIFVNSVGFGYSFEGASITQMNAWVPFDNAIIFLSMCAEVYMARIQQNKMKYLISKHTSNLQWLGSINYIVAIFCTAYSLYYHREKTLYMHCSPNYHYIPTISSIFESIVTRYIFGGVMILNYLNIMTIYKLFEIICLSIVLFVSSKHSFWVHYSAAFGFFLSSTISNNMFKENTGLLILMGISFYLHDRYCWFGMFDIFAILEWILFYLIIKKNTKVNIV